MKLGLIKNESNVIFFQDTTKVKFEFLKNMIKKDLEVACWSNKAVKVFGEFQIYSDCRAELNSFDFIVSYLTGKNVDFTDDSLELHVACQCPEYFLNLLILKDHELKKVEIEILAIKFTNYLSEATRILIETTNEDAKKLLLELDEQYFKGTDPTVWKYINPQYFN